MVSLGEPTSAGQGGKPEVIGVQHIESGHYQRQATHLFEGASIRVQTTQIFEPTDADGAHAYWERAPDSECEKKSSTYPGRAQPDSRPEKNDQRRSADRADGN